MDFPPEKNARLLKAADLYDRIALQVLADADHGTSVIAPYPSEGETWNQAIRQEQIRRMETAHQLDREAIGEIEK